MLLRELSRAAVALMVTVVALPSPAANPSQTNAGDISHGRYLTIIGGCNDCHTEGYAESGGKVPQKDWLQGSVLGHRGPWGTTYAVNLRAKLATMSEAEWITYAQTLKTRPPMPWFTLNQWSIDDLRALYRYVRDLGPAGASAPAYLAPDKEPNGSGPEACQIPALYEDLTGHEDWSNLHLDHRDVTFAASVPLAVPGHSGATHTVDSLLGRFTDIAHAYRFGGPSHDVVHAVWMSDRELANGEGDVAHSRFGGVPIIDEAVLLVHGDQRPMAETGLEAHIVGIDASGAVDLSVSAASLAQHVRIGSAGHVASDSYFMLLPGVERRVRLTPHGSASGGPIVVHALNDSRALFMQTGALETAAQVSAFFEASTENVARGAA